MQVRLFGGLEATQDGVPVPVRGAKQRALLALLALRRGQPVSADRLIDALWGDGQAANPANALQAQIGQLRRTLGPGAIVTTEAGYALDVGPEDVDVVRFEHLVAQGRRLAEAGEAADASAALGEALRLRRGEPLAEFAYAGFVRGTDASSADAGFADAERAHLDELMLVAIETRAGADLVLGRHGELAAELEAWCRRHPLRERLWELLILALYRAGRQAEALRAYTEVRDRLVDELGLDPGPALRDLETRILAQHPSLSPEPLPSTQEPPAPEPPAPEPPAPEPPAPEPPAPEPPAQAGNLRERLSSFVGRDAELAQLRETVRASRLVTLIGPGGAGKTRLAVEAAAVLREEHPDGAWLVELAGVAEPAGVAPAAAHALGAAPSALASPQPVTSTAEFIVRHLAGRSLVVVLDNCEHVIGEAATLADTLVTAVPGLRLIATSREPLGVPGEVLVPVGGLAPPGAAELFADRARAVRPGFTADEDAIADICARLDGLPLAVELAAARLRALPLATLADRLDDRFRLLTGGARTARPRQQTLRAVVDWSYDLLFEDERRLFTRLATFTGGCELAAAEAVCADEHVPAADILDVLARLVDKSLVTAPGPGDQDRFSQLQTLWAYGRDRLAESGEADAIRARHGAYYRQLARQAHDGLRGATGPGWRDRLAAESGNLRAALDWFVAAGDAEGALSLTSGMAWLWFINGDFAEGERWLGDALGAPGPQPTELAAIAHVWHGYCVGMSADPDAGVIECAQAVGVLRAAQDQAPLAEALVLWATVLGFAHHFGRSLDALSEARDLLEPPGKGVQGWLMAAHQLIVAWNLLSLGRLADAEAVARSSLARFDAEGEILVVVSPLNALASIAEARGDLEAASAAYEALLARCRATGQRLQEPFSLVALAALRARQGHDALADGLYADAIGCSFNPWLSADAMVGQAAAVRRLGDLPRARALLEAAGRYYADIALPAGQARVLAGLAWWALAASHPDQATIFAADATRAADASGDPATQLLADTAAAAVKAIADPARPHADAFVALARQRAQGLAYRSLTDQPDVAALAARLSPSS